MFDEIFGVYRVVSDICPCLERFLRPDLFCPAHSGCNFTDITTLIYGRY